VKYNFLNKGNNLTPADIKAQMNFNNVVKGASIWAGFKLGSTLLKLGTKMTTAVVAGTSTVVVTAAVVVATNTDLLKSTEPSPRVNAPIEEILVPTITDSTNQETTEAIKPLDSLVAAIEDVPQKEIEKVAIDTDSSQDIPERIGVTDSIRNVDVQLKARPLPDFSTFYAFINKELKYPIDQISVDINDQNEVSKSKVGFVQVFWTINKEGNAEHFKILKSMGESFDNEAIRVIKMYENWEPASYNGEAVESNLKMKIHFNVK
jgi:hypothetical protein